MTTLHTLAAFLALNGATPSVTTADCTPTDHGCKAKRSEQRAASAIKPDERATYLRSAHLSYVFLFEKTGNGLDLCSARRTFDESLAVKDQSADERARTQKHRKDLVALERKAGTSCKSMVKQRRVSRSDAPPVVARTTSPKAPSVDSPVHTTELTSEPPPPLASAATPESPPVPEPSPSPSALPSSVNNPRPDATLMQIPTRRAPPRPHTDGPRPGRGLVIAGSVTLGAGVVLTGVAGRMGRRMNETRQEYFTLVDSVAGFATSDQDAKAGGLFRDYNEMRTQALALGVAGGTTIILAAVLAGLGGRRMARAASRTALVPVPGGLALHAQF